MDTEATTNVLMHKVGPLPVVAWVGIGAGGVFLYRMMHNKSQATSSGTSTSQTAGVPVGNQVGSPQQFFDAASQIGGLTDQLTSLQQQLATSTLGGPTPAGPSGSGTPAPGQSTVVHGGPPAGFGGTSQRTGGPLGPGVDWVFTNNDGSTQHQFWSAGKLVSNENLGGRIVGQPISYWAPDWNTYHVEGPGVDGSIWTNIYTLNKGWSGWSNIGKYDVAPIVPSSSAGPNLSNQALIPLTATTQPTVP